MQIKLSPARFSEADIRALEPAMKVGLLATVNADGLPHITLITTLKAASDSQLVFGQFMEGLSKMHLRQNPKAGWLIMTLDKNVWRGKASFTHTSTSGPDYDFFNNTPLFRYNAYFGVHTVYYLDLVEQSGMSPLPMNSIILAALKTMLARPVVARRPQAAVLNPWTVGFLNQLSCLKFLAYIDASGFPVIVPAIQAQAAGRQLVIFSTSVYAQELEIIPAGAPVAVFGMSLNMEDVLLRGAFQGLQRVAGVRCGSVKTEWVYNPMPPIPGQIYPEIPLQPITRF